MGFERACRQHVEDELVQLGGVKVGRFWDRHAEADVVAVHEDGTVVLAGECQWSSVSVGLEVGKGQGGRSSSWPKGRASRPATQRRFSRSLDRHGRMRIMAGLIAESGG